MLIHSEAAELALDVASEGDRYAIVRKPPMIWTSIGSRCTVPLPAVGSQGRRLSRFGGVSSLIPPESGCLRISKIETGKKGTHSLSEAR
jgi:hypothetical protein